MELRQLLGVFTIANSNMKMVHWKVKGDDFDAIHKATDRYIKEISYDLDFIAESCLRNDVNPLSYIEVLQICKGCPINIEILPSDISFTAKEAVHHIDIILGHLLVGIELTMSDSLIKSEKSMGIRSTLEAMYDKYDKQKRFINKRRKGE